MKGFWTIFCSLILIIALALIVQVMIWNQFSPEKILQETKIEDQGQLQANASLWFKTYSKAFQGWRVPFSHRLKGMEIALITPLDAEHVQLELRLRPFLVSDPWKQAWEALEGQDSWYTSQMVVRLQKDREGHIQVTEKMRPVQYQITHDPSIFEENLPKTYVMPNRQYTYLFKDQKLYITFDHGKTTSLVPIPYAEVISQGDERIPFNSAFITPEFSAFVGYKERDAYLFYSTDAGKSWQSSSIANYASRSRVSISKNQQGIYVSLPVDRSLGRDYYALFFSKDGKTWEKLPGDYALSFFSSKNMGYLVPHRSEAVLLRTMDQAQSTEEILLSPPAEIQQSLGYNPFVQVEEIEEKDGEILVLVGQGPDGDYARESRLVKALYRSKDGEHFEFEKEVLEENLEDG